LPHAWLDGGPSFSNVVDLIPPEITLLLTPTLLAWLPARTKGRPLEGAGMEFPETRTPFTGPVLSPLTE
jgi:hypothetical protein